ncbi:hypothetical protein ZWY2020_011141 [Hordeum vulgare]|nr:hypothetical protein ZWY2020_011141 [Hordeum vulgare]
MFAHLRANSDSASAHRAVPRWLRPLHEQRRPRPALSTLLPAGSAAVRDSPSHHHAPDSRCCVAPSRQRSCIHPSCRRSAHRLPSPARLRRSSRPPCSRTCFRCSTSKPAAAAHIAGFPQPQRHRISLKPARLLHSPPPRRRRATASASTRPTSTSHRRHLGLPHLASEPSRPHLPLVRPTTVASPRSSDSAMALFADCRIIKHKACPPKYTEARASVILH